MRRSLSNKLNITSNPLAEKMQQPSKCHQLQNKIKKYIYSYTCSFEYGQTTCAPESVSLGTGGALLSFPAMNWCRFQVLVQRSLLPPAGDLLRTSEQSSPRAHGVCLTETGIPGTLRTRGAQCTIQSTYALFNKAASPVCHVCTSVFSQPEYHKGHKRVLFYDPVMLFLDVFITQCASTMQRLCALVSRIQEMEPNTNE